ncbi:hypothetical protein LCGC14_0338360 [marine sediment metagenome]|uniref:Uncharacterized protein n=1 Tax=marine sediment metagenome TaxID=412755 RepID=A0A0F9TXE6_9ZZZZ
MTWTNRARETQMCGCGAWEKIEAALERILSRKKGINFRHSENILCAWDNEMDYEVECANLCDLPAAIMELRDKVDSPKPEEREWREGDYVERLDSVDTRIKAGEVRVISEVVGEGRFRIWRKNPAEFHATKDSSWRNLTIEGEMAGEKE